MLRVLRERLLHCSESADGETFSRHILFPGDCQIHSIALDELLKDYGCSGGEYAMEADAFARFQSLAQQHGITYEAEAFDGDDSIMIVEINQRV